MKVNGTAVSNGDQSNASPTVYADSFRAEKSYFMFDDEIVCLGAGIQNSGSDAPVITTVENRKLSSGGSNQIAPMQENGSCLRNRSFLPSGFI